MLFDDGNWFFCSEWLILIFMSLLKLEGDVVWVKVMFYLENLKKLYILLVKGQPEKVEYFISKGSSYL